ncbi:MAG: ATP-binding cassette domain-containing protein [Polyangiaceae bacterium]
MAHAARKSEGDAGKGRRGPTIELSRVTRRFGRTVAVDGASARFEPGEIHAVIGENGAGKSTLLKLAAGVLAPSSGEVKIAGELLVPAEPREAARRNVLMVHQHFMLVGAFTALENLMLGNEPAGAGGVLDEGRARREVEALAERTGLTVPLDAQVDALGVGDKQRLEILRVLHRGALAILLDEPTAVLTPQEAADLYATLRALAEEGRTIVVVTHRLDEVVRFADRVTVMRRGRTVMSRALDRAGGASAEELTRAIMGQEPPPRFAPPEVAGTRLLRWR